MADSTGRSFRIGRPIYIAIACLVVFLYMRQPSWSPKPSLTATKARAVAPRAAQIPLGPTTLGDTSKLQQRVVAVGDIHGDLPALTAILRRAALVDLKGNWIGDDTVLVSTGDLVDRGRDLIAITRFFDQLRPQAEKAGGAVVNLLGNHELMNALGDWRYVTKEDIATFGGERQRRAAISTGWIGQTWRSNYSITARVPFTHNMRLPASLREQHASIPAGSSSRSFVADAAPAKLASSPFTHAAASFVHGGMTPEYLSSLTPSAGQGLISYINEIGHSILVSILAKNSPLSLPNGSTPEQREFWSERGPMWNREYALDDDEEQICARARQAADKLGVRHLIMGHTPHFEGILSRCDGLILLIDTGISRAYGGAHSALEILYTLTPEDGRPVDAEELDSASRSPRRWLEVETVKALYTRGRESELHAEMKRIVEF